MSRIGTKALFAETLSPLCYEAQTERPSSVESEGTKKGLAQLFFQAGLSISPIAFLLLSLTAGIIFSAVFLKLLSVYFIPIYFLIGGALPFLWLESRIRRRAEEFSADYPAVLLAAASSVKVGLTPYQALERATRLLSEKSLVRAAVNSLLSDLREGVPRQSAIRKFGADIRQPDLELFRSAFFLVLESGGKFSPTLQRLASISNNRATLIRSAMVSTASMRMTANVLVGVAPVLLLIVAARTPNFWELFQNHPVANFVGSIGILLITVCYGVLRQMSNFRP